MFKFFTKKVVATSADEQNDQTVSEVMGIELDEALSKLTTLKNRNLDVVHRRITDITHEIDIHAAELESVIAEHNRVLANLEAERDWAQNQIDEADRWFNVFGPAMKIKDNTEVVPTKESV